MKFNNRVSIREEDGGVLLYQAANSALVKLKPEIFSAVLNADETNAPVNELTEILSQLKSRGFFESPAISHSNSIARKLHVRETDGYFKLKSRRAPVSALWEITSKCNLTCPYCFPDVKNKRRDILDLSTADMFRICDQLIASKVLRVTLSGGEALLRDDISGIMDKLAAHPLTVALITNGVHGIPERLLRKIKDLNIYVAVSLDGCNEAVNQITRGPRAFDKTMETLATLQKNDINRSGICTVTRHNFETLTETLKCFRRFGVSSVALQDLRPFGTREIYDAYRLTPEQELALPAVLMKLEQDFPDIGFNFSELLVFGNPLKPALSAGKVMECPAGEHFVYIDVRGDAYPCTQYKHFTMGNLVRDNLSDIWQNNAQLNEFLRMKERPRATIPGCVGCERSGICRGGCRSDALYYTGNSMGLPSRCPRQLAEGASGSCSN